MWQRIGVQTEVDPLPWTSFVSQANKQVFSAFLLGWGTATAEASDALIAQLATYNPDKGWGAANRGRYSNPALDKLLDQALATADDPAREKLLQQAMKLAMDDVGLIPLHIQKNIWATRANLSYVPTEGEDLFLVNVKPIP
jgi:peptide/nickel transport system substrate-binding protein